MVRARASSRGTWPIGTAGEVTGATGVSPWGPRSVRLPQAWHSPHRPTHLAASQPHSAHTNAPRSLALLVLAMLRTLGGPTDI